MSFARLLLTLLFAALLSPSVRSRAEDAELFTPAPTVAAREYAVGELLPDIELQNQDGHVTFLHDFRGKGTAITFFYSRCPLPTFCPMVSRHFDQAQALLIRLGAGGRCHLLSLSLDAKNDSPEALAMYARTHGADPLLWTFAGGREENVLTLGKSVGLEFKRVGERIDHNLRTVVVDASGRLCQIFRGDSWTPQELVVALQSAARTK